MKEKKQAETEAKAEAEPESGAEDKNEADEEQSENENDEKEQEGTGKAGQEKEKTSVLVDLDDWLSVEDGADVEVSGTITVLPGVFQKRTAFIQGGSDGAQPVEMYFHHADWPELEFYQQVNIRGEKSISQKGHRLLIRSKNDITAGPIKEAEIFKPQSFEELSDLQENTLVSAKGGLIEQRKNSLTLDFSGQELFINLESADLALQDYAERSEITVIGIVKHDDEKTELWPRSLDDINAEKLQEEVEEPSESALISVETGGDSSHDSSQAGWMVLGSASTMSVMLAALYRKTFMSQALHAVSAIKTKLTI